MSGTAATGQKTDRLSSPEQLNDYLKVTNPKIWVLLAAVVLLVAGLLVWSAFAVVETYATGTARASSGELAVVFSDQQKAQNVQAGMELQVGDTQTEILTVGTDESGNVIASAQAAIPDGVYEVRVGYNATQVITLLFN